MDERHLRIAVPRRDSRFERETSVSELHVKMEMDRALAVYFTKKHGTAWRWCPTCRAWSDAHPHPAVSRR